MAAERLDLWAVPLGPMGTELKLSYEMFAGILRAVGGKLVVNQQDMLVLDGEVITSYRTEDPPTFVWELKSK